MAQQSRPPHADEIFVISFCSAKKERFIPPFCFDGGRLLGTRELGAGTGQSRKAKATEKVYGTNPKGRLFSKGIQYIVLRRHVYTVIRKGVPLLLGHPLYL